MLLAIYQTYRRAYSGLPLAIWHLSAALLINRIGTMVLPFLSLYLTQSLHFTPSAATDIMSVFGFGSIVGVYVGSRIASKMGCIRAQVLLLVGSVPCFLLIPAFTNWWAIAFSVLALSICVDGVRPASAAAVAEFSDRTTRMRAFGLQRMAANLGTSIGPAIGGVLSTIHFAALFYVDAVSTLLCAVALAIWFPGRLAAGSRPDHSSIESSLDRTRDGAAVPTKRESPLKNWRLSALLVINFLTATVFFQFLATYPLYLESHYGLSRPAIGAIYAVNTVLIVLFEMVLVSWLARFQHLVIIAIGAFLSCIGFAILPLSNATWFAVVAMVIATVGEMLWMPIATGWVSSQVEQEDQAAAMGWYQMTYSLAFVASPVVFGRLYQLDSDLPWLVSAPIAVVVFAATLGLQKSYRVAAKPVAARPA